MNAAAQRPFLAFVHALAGEIKTLLPLEFRRPPRAVTKCFALEFQVPALDYPDQTYEIRLLAAARLLDQDKTPTIFEYPLQVAYKDAAHPGEDRGWIGALAHVMVKGLAGGIVEEGYFDAHLEQFTAPQPTRPTHQRIILEWPH